MRRYAWSIVVRKRKTKYIKAVRGSHMVLVVALECDSKVVLSEVKCEDSSVV